MSELEAQFRTAVGKRAKSVEWRSVQAMPVPYVVHQARAADILVVGARSEAIVDPCAAADPSALLIKAGRPIIVVPPAVEWFDFRSVLVAWKDVREARRAILDALPILATAKDITVAEIRAPIAPMRCYMLRTWRRGCLATVSLRAPWFRSQQPG